MSGHKKDWPMWWYLIDSLWTFQYIYISSYIIFLVLSGCDGGGGPFHPSVPSSVWSSKFLIPEEEDDGRGGRRRRMAAAGVYPNVYVIQSCSL